MRRLIATLLTLSLAAVPLEVGDYPSATIQAQPPPKPVAAKQKRPKPKAKKPVPKRERREPIVMYATLTAYTGTDAGMRGDDITASGTKARAWETVAAWPGVPFGSRIEVPALGKTFVVEDRGGAIGPGRLDVYVGHDDKAAAMEFGRKRLEVKIYAPLGAQ